MAESPRISIAIPLYNEEQVLAELLQRTTAVLDGLPGGPHEIVCVDDGSSDSSCDSEPNALAGGGYCNNGESGAFSPSMWQAREYGSFALVHNSGNPPTSSSRPVVSLPRSVAYAL